jgi:hypothetical protein
MKKIMVNFTFKGATTQQYDAIMDDLYKLGILNNSGLLFHACATSSTGLKINDLWESEESFKKFGETLMPLLKKHGIEAVPPEIFPMHNMVKFLAAAA